MAGGHSIDGVEVFRIGQWNGDQYSERDLDLMVSAFGKVGFSVPLKLGHSTAVGEAAYGWVRKVYRKGSKLLADLAEIPGELFRAIKEGRYKHVSAEIFWNLERDGNKYPRVLKAIALLGAETPAVSNLAPLQTTLSLNCSFVTYASKLHLLEDDDDYDDDEETEMSDPSAALDRLTRNYMHANPEMPYSKALHAVQTTDEGRSLMAAYNAEKRSGVHTYKTFQSCSSCSDTEGCKKMGMCKSAARSSIKAAKYADPSAELHKRAKAILLEEGANNYSAAVRVAMKADPELASEYANWSVNH